MNADHVQFLTAVLIHIKDASVDWEEVAKVRGISRKDNCATSFKNMIKKYGVEYQKDCFVPTADFQLPSTMNSDTTSARRSQAIPRKRKAKPDNVADGSTTGDTPSKKVKTIQNNAGDQESDLGDSE